MSLVTSRMEDRLKFLEGKGIEGIEEIKDE